ncbi:FimD/PapC N-terminal domain-containing protein [Escherichia coli]
MPEYRSSCQSWYKKISVINNKEHSAEKHVPDNSACTPLQDRLADASTEFDVGQQHLSLSVPQIYVGRMVDLPLYFQTSVITYPITSPLPQIFPGR